MAHAIANPALIEEAREALVHADFRNPDIAAIRDAILDM